MEREFGARRFWITKVRKNAKDTKKWSGCLGVWVVWYYQAHKHSDP